MSFRFSWLKCAVSEGMFPSEYAVECEALDKTVFSFFVPTNLVNRDKGWVKVRELECKEGYCLVFLPANPLEESNRIIKVDSSKLVAA